MEQSGKLETAPSYPIIDSGRPRSVGTRITFGNRIIEFDTDGSHGNDVLRQHFVHARTTAEAADVRIRLSVVPGELPKPPSGTPYRLHAEKGRFDFGPGVVWGDVEPGGAIKATMIATLLEAENIFLFDRFVCHVLFTVAPSEWPLVIHGAALSENGRGAILFGPPGAGKSTASALAREALRLHDDMAVVHRASGQLVMSGAPFDPRQRHFDRGQATLAVICSLHHADDVRLERSDARALFRALLPETLHPRPLTGEIPKAGFDHLMAGVRALAGSIPYYRLHFRPDRSFWPELRTLL